jgi:hypothetical protein
MEIDTIAGSAAGNALTGNYAPSVNTWHHLAFVHSGTTFTLYLDGVTVAGTLSGTVSSSALNITRLYNYFGTSQNGHLGDVQLDEIKLYNKALTQTQVQLDMNAVGIPNGVC